MARRWVAPFNDHLATRNTTVPFEFGLWAARRARHRARVLDDPRARRPRARNGRPRLRHSRPRTQSVSSAANQRAASGANEPHQPGLESDSCVATEAYDAGTFKQLTGSSAPFNDLQINHRGSSD